MENSTKNLITAIKEGNESVKQLYIASAYRVLSEKLAEKKKKIAKVMFQKKETND